MTQIARPISDISSGGWSPSSGADLYAMLDEAIPDGDGTYITGTNGCGTCEVKLGALQDPESSTGHFVTISGKSLGSGKGESIDIFLYQGTTEIAQPFNNYNSRNIYFPETVELTTAEADAITDYSDLRFRIVEESIGAGEEFRVTVIYFEIPNAQNPPLVVDLTNQPAIIENLAQDSGVQLGSITLAQSPGAGLAMAVDPVVVQSSMVISLDSAASEALAIDPNVDISDIILSAGFGLALVTATDPIVIQSSMVVSLAAGPAKAQAIDPGVQLGSLTLAMAQGIIEASGVDPSTQLGSISLAMAAAIGEALGVDPAIILGNVTVGLVAGIAEALAVDPTVTTAGGIFVELVAGLAVASGADPGVQLGPISLALTAGIAEATGQDPAIVMGSVTKILDVGLALATGVDPTVSTGGDLFVALTHADAVATGQDPTLVMDSMVVDLAGPALIYALGVDPMAITFVPDVPGLVTISDSAVYGLEISEYCNGLTISDAAVYGLVIDDSGD